MKEKILVIQTAFLGDSILTLPMIGKLKEKYPSSTISILCIPSSAELFRHALSVDEVIVYDKKGTQKSFAEFFLLINKIREKKFTRIYSPHRSLRTSIIVLFSGAGSKTGFDTAAFSIVYNTKIRYSKEKHEVARNLDLIGYNTSGLNWKIVPQVDPGEAASLKIDKMLDDIGSVSFAVVAPGSVWNTKIYPAEYFADVIRFLREKKYFVFLIGSAGEDILCRQIEGQFISGVKSVAGKLTVTESIALLKKAELLISNDSAPTHLGMIADIPTITIYCSTIPEFGFYPYNKRSRFVSLDGLKCKPCGIHGHKECPIKTFDCGMMLMPDTVISSVKEILKV